MSAQILLKNAQKHILLNGVKILRFINCNVILTSKRDRWAFRGRLSIIEISVLFPESLLCVNTNHRYFYVVSFSSSGHSQLVFMFIS